MYEKDQLASDEDVHAYEHLTNIVDIRDYPAFYRAEEEKVLKAWFAQRKHSPDEPNDYEPILYRGEFFNRHGLNPVYFVDPDTNRIFVTSEEFLDGKLN